MSEPTFVAMTTSSWRPRAAIQRPMIVSDSPPWWPVTQREYESAVSIRLKPASTNASSRWNDVASSTVQPNTLPPNATGATSNPVLPSLRRFIQLLLEWAARVQRRVASHRPAFAATLFGQHHPAHAGSLPDDTSRPVGDPRQAARVVHAPRRSPFSDPSARRAHSRRAPRRRAAARGAFRRRVSAGTRPPPVATASCESGACRAAPN